MTTEPMTEPLSPTITFSEVVLTADLIDLVMPLLEAHYREIAHYADISLSIDRDLYVKMGEQGLCRVFLCLDGTVIHGYAVFFVRPNSHYTTSLQAVQDILYLVPQIRGRMLGAQFIDWCDEQLRRQGVQVVTHHVKVAHDFGPTLQRLGYEHVENVWMRRLDRRA